MSKNSIKYHSMTIKKVDTGLGILKNSCEKIQIIKKYADNSFVLSDYMNVKIEVADYYITKHGGNITSAMLDIYNIK